jgi:hypothetical protein
LIRPTLRCLLSFEVLGDVEGASNGNKAEPSKSVCPVWCSDYRAGMVEYLSERRVRHSWCCEMCGYQFESTVYFATPEPTVGLEAA